jgi:hypothetical protein
MDPSFEREKEPTQPLLESKFTAGSYWHCECNLSLSWVFFKLYTDKLEIFGS